MSTQLLKMNKLIRPLVIGATVSLLANPPVFSLSTDQDRDIVIAADKGELDDVKSTTIYTGNVIVDQGSMRITGDKMTVYYTDDNDIDVLVMEGNPATYRQLPDESDIYDEARALRMEYHKPRNLVILIQDAMVKQKDGTLQAERIEYDSELSRATATSGPKNDGAEAKEGDRVKIIIPSKPD